MASTYSICLHKCFALHNVHNNLSVFIQKDQLQANNCSRDAIDYDHALTNEMYRFVVFIAAFENDWSNICSSSRGDYKTHYILQFGRKETRPIT